MTMRNNAEVVEKPIPVLDINDKLPDGTAEYQYMNANYEWPGLSGRLGEPRIFAHPYFIEAMAWVQLACIGNEGSFSFLDAGCGHGNDVRALRTRIVGNVTFLGVDLSVATLQAGLDYYENHENENRLEAQKLFAVGNLRDLRRVYTLEGMSLKPLKIEDASFDLVYFEAMLQASGHGYGTYRQKKEAAQKILNELARVTKPGGKLLGRVTVFASSLSKEQRFDVLRQEGNWRFIPGGEEFLSMLEEAGFKNSNGRLSSPYKLGTETAHKEYLRFPFLAER